LSAEASAKAEDPAKGDGMQRRRVFTIGAALTFALAAATAQGPQVPTFQVDPFWPKPLPNHWLFGSITGIAVDAQDHMWVVHRGASSLNARTEMGAATDPPTAEGCCVPAPQVLHFDRTGKVVSHFGGRGQGYDWPQSPGGITVDAKGNVWIAAAGPADPQPGGGRRGGAAATTPAAPPPNDAHVLKFSGDGKFLLQIGKVGETGDDDSTSALNRPTAVEVDTAAGEVYVADGVNNHRIVVFDAETGKYKRRWGAHGIPAEGEQRRVLPFNVPACVKLSKDGLVYVCDRRNNRIQVFRKDGTFVKETVIAKDTRREGSAWSIAFSSDLKQQFLYLADGSNQKVWVLQRDSLSVVSSVGTGGRWPGQFYGVSSVAVDSSGNLYTGETYEGKRVQKFNFKGLRSASKVQR
jgi:DNA-binding beta-propeller fold protein YncE